MAAAVGERAADLVAVHPGQVAVEHDDVVVGDGRVRERVVAVEGDVDGHPLTPQAVGNRLGEALVVFDDEHAHRHSMPRDSHSQVTSA